MADQVITPVACDCGRCPPESEFARIWTARHWYQYQSIRDDEAGLGLVKAWHHELEERAERTKEGEVERRLRIQAELPPRAVACVGPEAAETPAIAALRTWHDDNMGACGPIVILSGPPGVGKTVAACWYALKHVHWLTFVTAAQYARMSRFGDEREKLHEASVWILDDLGAEYLDKGGSWLADFDELMDRLYRDETTVVITTNLNAKQFRSRYGARVVDRLAECGTWVNVPGPSLRGRP